jgi:D-lactate dehydrogenase
VGIETGILIKALRGTRASPLAERTARTLARHYGAVTTAVGAGLACANALSALRGPAETLRGWSGGRLPKWSTALPRRAAFAPGRASTGSAARVVYFPSCATRTMGRQHGDDADPLPQVAERLFRKAGYDVVMPAGVRNLCCGQPFESKGFPAVADEKSAELEAALRAARIDGSEPIVFDTSPCAYRMKRYLAGRFAIQDSVEFLHDAVLPRVALARGRDPVTVHPVCSVRKMGTVDKLEAVARACSENVITVPGVLCCGFAGDKGFTTPELNEYALRHLTEDLPAACRHGYSTSRTCEIGLSERAGFPYRSIIDLVDACVQGRAS